MFIAKFTKTLEDPSNTQIIVHRPKNEEIVYKATRISTDYSASDKL